MLPTTNFAVAVFKKYVLYNVDYKTLSRDHRLSNFLMEFVAQMFAAERKDLQIETLKTKQPVTNLNDYEKNVKIQSSNFLGIHLLNEHYCLVILNTIKQTFSTLILTNLNRQINRHITTTSYNLLRNIIQRTR